MSPCIASVDDLILRAYHNWQVHLADVLVADSTVALHPTVSDRGKKGTIISLFDVSTVHIPMPRQAHFHACPRRCLASHVLFARGRGSHGVVLLDIPCMGMRRHMQHHVYHVHASRWYSQRAWPSRCPATTPTFSRLLASIRACSARSRCKFTVVLSISRNDRSGV